MPTLQELLASGDLYNSTGTINVAAGRNSVANLLNQGIGYSGRAGLDMPGYVYNKMVSLPQLYTRSGYLDTSTDTPTQAWTDPVAISYADALARNFKDVNVSTDDGYRSVANFGDVYDVAGLQSPELRSWVTNRIASGASSNEYGAYIPEAAYNSLLNDLSGYNAADESAFNTNALMALAAVIGAGTLSNVYGPGAAAGEGATATSGAPIVEGGMSTAEIDAAIAANGGAPVVSGGYSGYGTLGTGATTYGIGNAPAPITGTPLSPSGTPSVAGMSASEELAAAGFTPEQIATFQETGFLPAGVAGAGGVLNTINNVSAVSSGGSALSRILDGSASKADWLSVLGTAGATGLGIYSDIQKTNALNDLSEKYAGYGAPYRQRLSDLYANPSSFLSSPEVQVPVQQGTDAVARSLSAKVGNPVFSGTALQELQNYSSNQLFSKLGQEKDRLAGFGGLTAYNSAAPGAATNAINSSGNALTTLAGGVSDIFNPRQTLTDLLKQYQGNNLFGVA